MFCLYFFFIVVDVVGVGSGVELCWDVMVLL